MSHYRALALQKLGQAHEARNLLEDLRAYADQLACTEPKIDYFATSLPTMLLFDEDLRKKNAAAADFLSAQALIASGAKDEGVKRLQAILKDDPNHALATDLLAEIEINEALHAGSSKAR